MIDQTTLNFFAKLTLTCIVLTFTLVKNVECRAIQDQQQQVQYNSEISAAPSTNQVYQYQQQQQESPYYQQQQGGSPSVNYQYYDQQPQQSAQYPKFTNDIENSSSTNNKPNRRSILSSIMQPLYSMRDQGMTMLRATLEGCSPNVFSMWCRFWSMFIRRR